MARANTTGPKNVLATAAEAVKKIPITAKKVVNISRQIPNAIRKKQLVRTLKRRLEIIPEDVQAGDEPQQLTLNESNHIWSNHATSPAHKDARKTTSVQKPQDEPKGEPQPEFSVSTSAEDYPVTNAPRRSKREPKRNTTISTTAKDTSAENTPHRSTRALKPTSAISAAKVTSRNKRNQLPSGLTLNEFIIRTKKGFNLKEHLQDKEVRNAYLEYIGDANPIQAQLIGLEVDEILSLNVPQNEPEYISSWSATTTWGQIHPEDKKKIKQSGGDPNELFNDDKETETKGRFFAPLIGGTHKDERDAVNDEIFERNARKRRTRRDKAAEEEDEEGELEFPPQIWVPGMPLVRKRKGETLFWYRTAPPTTRYVDKRKAQEPEPKWNQPSIVAGPITIDPPGSGGPFDALNHPDRLIYHFERNAEDTMDGWDEKALKNVPEEILRRLSDLARSRLPDSLQQVLREEVVSPTTATSSTAQSAPAQKKKGISKKRAASPAATEGEGRKPKRVKTNVAGGAALLEQQNDDVQVISREDFPQKSVEQPAASATSSAAAAAPAKRASKRIAAKRAASEVDLIDEVTTAPPAKRQKRTDAEPVVAPSVRVQSGTGGRKVKRMKNNHACKACAKAHRGCKGAICPYRTQEEKRAADLLSTIS